MPQSRADSDPRRSSALQQGQAFNRRTDAFVSRGERDPHVLAPRLAIKNTRGNENAELGEDRDRSPPVVIRVTGPQIEPGFGMRDTPARRLERGA